MKKYSNSWKSSTNRRKQRKFRLNAPLHIKRKFLNAGLSKDLKTKNKKNSIPLRKGDTVKIMRGQFKKQTGKIARVDLKSSCVYIEGIEMSKKDGTKVQRPIHASNVQIISASFEDQKRKKMLNRGKKQ